MRRSGCLHGGSPITSDDDFCCGVGEPRSDKVTEERWPHILEAVKDPDFVAKGLHGELKTVRLSIDLPMGARYVVVVYREVSAKDGFIITARVGSGVANAIKGGVIWRKK